MSLSDGFETQQEQFISEINCLARLYRHRKTGAEVLSLSGKDENKVFGVSFRTPPSDSTGIAHIMEHSVLCGSRKYPVKAPFLEMLKSSLYTFLNAMTFPDKTVYPVASTNLQDFYNLVDVYLDAVLHPRITPEILKQEGWHYELEAPDAPLTYKGVVFNEMKGGYSSPDDRVRRLSARSLFPDTTYGYDSGGNPAEIPNLTYENFKRFHERYYHPSNAKFFFYGDDDVQQRLEILGAALDEFSALDAGSNIEAQRRFDAPRNVEYPLPVNDDDASPKQAQITINWMLEKTEDPELGLALSVLDRILFGTSAAPLRKALIDSRLGDNLTGSGYGNWLLQSIFATGLKGIAEEDAPKVEALIFETLKDLADNGIDPMTVESAMNTMEFRLRENNTGTFPRGLSIFFRALRAWNYDLPPLEQLAWESHMNALKSRLASGERVFEDMITTYLLKNPHRTTAIFKPDPKLTAREASEERDRLDTARAAMAPNEVDAVIEDAKRLKALQEKADDPDMLAKIPQLKLSDLPKKNKVTSATSGTLSAIRLLSHDLPTNGIIYLDIGLNLRQLPAELLPLTGIFRRALLETGAGDMDMIRLSQTIGSKTGGIHAQSWTSAIIGGEGAMAWLFLRAKAMPDKLADLRQLLMKILFSANLDDSQRIAQIIDEERSGMEALLIPSGHQLISSRLRAGLHDSDWAEDQMSGVSYLLALRNFAEMIKSDPEQITGRLEQIRQLLLRKNAMIFNITADPDGIDQAKTELEELAGEIPEDPLALQTWSRPDYPHCEGLTIPAKVNYVAKGTDLKRFGRLASGVAIVVSHWLRGSWLWDKVRVQGGAYTSFCSADPISGLFLYGSYRDPNLSETLAAYDGAGKFLRDAAGNDLDRERAIIGTIGKLDTYKLPDARGILSLQRYLCGASDSWRQAIRSEILNLTAADIRDFADVLDSLAEHGRIVVMGAEDTLKAANKDLPEPFTLTRLM